MKANETLQQVAKNGGIVRKPGQVANVNAYHQQMQPRQVGMDGNHAVQYKCNGETVKLSANIVRQYLVSGNGNVTDQEIVLFINLCRFQHLNPFLREAYLVKYGNNNPATMVVGKDTFLKRARRNPEFGGFEAGVIVLNENSGMIESRTGSLVLPGENVVGGWAKVYIKGFEHPIESTVSFDEYVGRKRDGAVNGQWASKPATMIRKVALVQALREAFPEDFGAMYDQSEMGMETIDEAPIDVSKIPELKPTDENNTLQDQSHEIDHEGEQMRIDAETGEVISTGDADLDEILKGE